MLNVSDHRLIIGVLKQPSSRQRNAVLCISTLPDGLCTTQQGIKPLPLSVQQHRYILHNKRQQMCPVYKVQPHSAVEPMAISVMRVVCLKVYN